MLHELDLRINRLTGPIPGILGGLTSMKRLSLGANNLTGPIPQELWQLTDMTSLDLGINLLTGPIDSSIGNLTKLYFLDLHANAFSGALPHTMGSLGRLLGLYLERNQLTGSIVDELSDLRELRFLTLSYNRLVGAIPPALCNISQLQVLIANDNSLEGTIPSCVTSMIALRFLYVQNNALTGSVPILIGDMNATNYLDLSNNMLTGPITRSIGNLTRLITLALQGNRLTGPLTGRFSAAQADLLTIQLDNNQFTGELPSEIFDIPHLVSLSIVGSCLHGTLPDNICNAKHLQVLILYGLTTGKSCRASGVHVFYLSDIYFGGTVPPCLLSLPNLATVLMSSNGLVGTIPGNVGVGPKLLELDLCHNYLSGSIPNTVQNHSWSLLDLSHNKFTGVLRADLVRAANITVPAPVVNPVLNKTIHLPAATYAASAVLSLESNRLSGHVPSSIKPLRGMTVLAGNLFECKYDKSDLPQHDSDISNYQCASNSFDIAIYVWLSMLVCAMAIIVCAAYLCQVQLVRYRTRVIQLPDELSARIADLFTLLEEFYVLHKMAWFCAAYCLAVLMPCYAVVSMYAGTHTYQYAYVLSAIYVSGVVPFVLTSLLIALLFAVLYFGSLQRGENIVQVVAPIDCDRTRWNRRYVWCIFTVTNFTVVLGANIAFVYIVLYKSSQLQTVAQVALSVFKLSWSSLAAPRLIRELEVYFMAHREGPAEPFFTLQLLVALFNNIIIPCLVVAAIDSNCFSNIVLPPNPESVVYQLPVCGARIGESCLVLDYELTTMQFSPPFTYGYQCSASIITSYAPTFVYMSMSIVFLSPLLQLVLLRLHENLLPDSTAHRAVSVILPRILQSPGVEAPSALESRKRPVVGAVSTLVTLLTEAGILLTFGVIFPPVALAMAMSISATVLINRYKVQRFVNAIVLQQRLSYLSLINVECVGVVSRKRMQLAMRIVLCYCCAFYALFLFDTLGDSEGFAASVWVLFVVPLLPYALFGGVALYRKSKSEVSASQQRLVARSIEMSLATDINGIAAKATASVQGDRERDIVNILHASASNFDTV